MFHNYSISEKIPPTKNVFLIGYHVHNSQRHVPGYEKARWNKNVSKAKS